MTKKTTSSVRTGGTAENKLARRNARSNGSTPTQAEYLELNHTGICALIDAVVDHGGTVTFGTTRDGGAYYIGYWLDGESSKVYIRPNENPDAYIAGEIDFWRE